MNRKKQFASIDVETTGLQAGNHEIVELSIILFNPILEQGKVTKKFEITDSFTTKIRPMRPEVTDPKAMKINGLRLEDLKEKPTPQQIRNTFFNWHEEVTHNALITPLGHNFCFDQGFLKVFFGSYYPDIFSHKYHDTRSVAQSLRFLGKIPKTQSCKLEELCKYFEIKHKAHTAKGDALATIKLYEHLLELVT